MKPRRKPDADTAKEFLEQLAADRGPVLTDEEYESMHSCQLQNLANPPRIEWAVAAPGLLCILLGVGLLAAALVSWVTVPEDTTTSRLMVGLLLTELGSYFFFGNLRACRLVTRRSYAERKSEIDELLRSGLITAQEHETIRQAIDH